MLRTAAVALAFASLVTLPACRLLPFHRAAEQPAAIDLNTASRRKIEALPGVTPSMAQRIIDGRPYVDTDDLVERGILTRRELERLLDRVTVRDGTR
ncbi:MAG TPA: helix-hairpin-helix domain-containing protein [Candidatus Binatia bacterium]|nr:helix-hairpin-helix domain-containing protein [Candidatus Binatia bacterium]